MQVICKNNRINFNEFCQNLDSNACKKIMVCINMLELPL